MLPHSAYLFLNCRKQFSNSVHSMKIQIARDTRGHPIHADEDHVRGCTHKRLQAAPIETDPKVDQVG